MAQAYAVCVRYSQMTIRSPARLVLFPPVAAAKISLRRPEEGAPTGRRGEILLQESVCQSVLTNASLSGPCAVWIFKLVAFMEPVLVDVYVTVSGRLYRDRNAHLREPGSKHSGSTTFIVGRRWISLARIRMVSVNTNYPQHSKKLPLV